MSRRSRLWWFRQPWPWMVADLTNRAGWCWSDLVMWELGRTSLAWPRDEYGQGAPWTGARRTSVCARQAIDPAYTKTGSCYCGQVGPDSPGEARRRARRARWAPAWRGLALFGVTLGALLAASQVPASGPPERVPYDVGPTLTPPTGDLPRVACEPVAGGCAWRPSPGVTAFIGDPTPGPSASLVRGQLRDARDGVAP